MHDHTFFDQLFAYHKGGLSAEKRQQIATHLTDCPTCQRKLRRWEAESVRWQHSADQYRVDPPILDENQLLRSNQMNKHRRLQLAGVVALLVLIFTGWYTLQLRPPADPFVDTTTADSATAPDAVVEPVIENTAEPIVEETIEPVTEETVEPVAEEPAEKIILRVGAPHLNWEGYPQYERTFEALHPEIDLELVETGHLMAPEVAVVEADVLTTAMYSNLQEARGVLLDLAPFMAAAGISADDFYPNIANFDGDSLYVLPTAFSARVLGYDRAMFDEAGVPYPTVGWTFETLRQSAAALTERDGDTVTRWGLMTEGGDQALVVNQLENLPTSLFTTDAPATAPTSDQFITAVTAVSEMYGDSAHWWETDDPYFLFDHYMRERPAAMWTSDARWIETPDFVPLPNATGFDIAPRVQDHIAISANTAYPDVAWTFVQYVSENPLPNGGMMPARRSVAESENGYLAQFTPESADALRYIAENNAAHQHQTWERDIAYLSLQNIVIEGMSISEGIAAATAYTTDKHNNFIARMTDETTQTAPVESETEVIDDAADDAAAANPLVTTIRFVVEERDVEMYEALALEFELANPTYAIDVDPYGDWTDYYVFTEVLGEDADCFVSGRPISPDLRSVALPLTSYTDTLNAALFYDETFNSFAINGEQLALPLSFSSQIIQFNKAIFDAAGVPYPAGSWTQDQFITTAQAVMQGDVQYGYTDVSVFSIDIMLLGAQFETEPDGTLDVAAWSDAVQWYSDLVTAHGVIPTPSQQINWDYGTELQLIENGEVAMWQGHYAFAPNLPDAQIGYVAFPTGPTGKSHNVYDRMSGLYMHKESDNRDLCWEWMTYVSDNVVTNSFPARSDVAAAAAYTPDYFDAFSTMIADSYVRQSDMSATHYASGYNHWLRDAIIAVIDDGVTVADALAEAQRKEAVYTSCLVEQTGEPLQTNSAYVIDTLQACREAARQ